MARSQHGIFFKKEFGQNFLRDYSVIAAILASVTLDEKSHVLEIGCGDGFLTAALLETPIKKLIGYEIDPEWFGYVKNKFKKNTVLTLINEDVLQSSWHDLAQYKPLFLIANLPYNITFPLLYKIKENRHLFSALTIMVQEEVAQKICKISGKDYGFVSLFFQYYFDWKLLDKVMPESFEPSPNVYSRLLHGIPKQKVDPIANEAEFWEFVKACFKQPRRTLENNLKGTKYQFLPLIASYRMTRGQQMTIEDFKKIWSCHDINLSIPE